MKTMIVVVMDTVLFISPEKDAEKTNEKTDELTTGHGISNIPDHPAAAHPDTHHSEMG